MAIKDTVATKNAEYIKTFDKGHLPLPPGKQYLVVTCMDARIDPAAALGIELGDAHVIRNAGGSVKDALRSIIISQQLLGTKEVLVVKHTDCGMTTFQSTDALDKVEQALGSEAKAELGSGYDFRPFPNVEGAVEDDLAYLRKTKLVADDVVLSGWVYDVKTGKASQVA